MIRTLGDSGGGYSRYPQRLVLQPLDLWGEGRYAESKSPSYLHHPTYKDLLPQEERHQAQRGKWYAHNWGNLNTFRKSLVCSSRHIHGAASDVRSTYLTCLSRRKGVCVGKG